MNEHLETDIINGKGKAYGIELMAKKQAGTLNRLDKLYIFKSFD